MAVGEKYPFLQFSDSVIQTVDTAGATVTFNTSVNPDSEVRVQNMSTATCWIGLGTRSTSSASVTTKGMVLMPSNQQGCFMIVRTGGQTKLAAFTVGATQTTSILVTSGEGTL